MSDQFPIPKRVQAQLGLDGSEQELPEPEPDRLFPDPARPGEAGVLADCERLVEAGVARWVFP